MTQFQIYFHMFSNFVYDLSGEIQIFNDAVADLRNSI